MMEVCARMKEDGVIFVEDPTPMSMDPRYHVAFVKDPDGYEVELTDFP
jgi:catechol 2,3-dioxygenase-like lactoylglutathione lyase family enzyme